MPPHRPNPATAFTFRQFVLGYAAFRAPLISFMVVKTMAKYRLEIFEPAAGALDPVLRHRITIHANDDDAAAAKAIERYEDESRSITIAGSVLAGFVLYDGKRVVLERRRPIRSSERGN